MERWWVDVEERVRVQSEESEMLCAGLSLRVARDGRARALRCLLSPHGTSSSGLWLECYRYWYRDALLWNRLRHGSDVDQQHARSVQKLAGWSKITRATISDCQRVHSPIVAIVIRRCIRR